MSGAPPRRSGGAARPRGFADDGRVTVPAPALTLQLVASMAAVDVQAWDGLLARQRTPTPFLRHAYLAALEASASACAATGWSPHYALLHQGEELVGACALYLKAHSRGEYVFDWAWADAYARHGLAYYPKALVAVPFTPVPGSRLLARDGACRGALLGALLAWAKASGLSSLHLLLGDEDDTTTARAAGLLVRSQVQFHWHNRHPHEERRFTGFDDFLASLTQDKRKKIRQERRRVADAGVGFRVLEGAAIGTAEWDFFYRCYQRTYHEHGNAPYLTRDFFTRVQASMPGVWTLFVAERAGRPIASSLIASSALPTSAPSGGEPQELVAYGRYWGALERVDGLHFEACYYQPLAWCIARGAARFEGGAQGEHKLARALLPTPTHSAHWIARPEFARAIAQFVDEEGAQTARYLQALARHSPFRQIG